MLSLSSPSHNTSPTPNPKSSTSPRFKNLNLSNPNSSSSATQIDPTFNSNSQMPSSLPRLSNQVDTLSTQTPSSLGQNHFLESVNTLLLTVDINLIMEKFSASNSKSINEESNLLALLQYKTES